MKLCWGVCCLLLTLTLEAALSPTTWTPEGYYDGAVLWQQRSLVVCWENPSARTEQQQRLVQEALLSSWQQASTIDFVGFQACAQTAQPNIRVYIADEAPFTLGLGKRLDAVEGGVVLNLLFAKWGSRCHVAPLSVESCIKSMAMHEFGHVLGLAHEQNRDDRAADCVEPAQGDEENPIKVGSFDRESVMNYCYDGVYRSSLSAGDVHTLQQMYGVR